MRVLGMVTAGWAVVMAVAPLLQVRRIVRTGTVSVAYLLLRGHDVMEGRREVRHDAPKSHVA